MVGKATNHAHAVPVRTHGIWRGAASLARHGSKVIRGIIARKEGEPGNEARVPAEQIILETAAATLSFLLQPAYISVILHILWI